MTSAEELLRSTRLESHATTDDTARGLDASVRFLIRSRLCALLIGMFFLATIRDGHEWGDDFSMYIRHAQNIARGEPYAETGYIYNPQNPAIGPRVYPPGFPLLLAPVVGIYGLDLRPMKILIIGFFVGSLLVMGFLFRDDLPTRYMTVLVLVAGLNPFFWEFKDQILSDIPFLFFALSSLHLFRLAGSPVALPRRRTTLALLAGTAAYVSYATRALAIALIPSFIAYELCRHRRITSNAAVACAALAALAALQHLFWLHDASYFNVLSNPVIAAQQNAPAYLRSLSDLWENGHSSAVRKAAFLGGGFLAAFGYVTSLRTSVTVFHLFPPLYLAPVLLWPAFQGTRLMIPLVPFYFYYCLLGASRIDGAAERRWGRKNAVLGMFLAVALISYAGRYSTLEFGPLPHGIEKRESRELVEFVKARTGPEDVLVFSRPRALALLTRRRVSGGYSPADPCQLWQYVSRIGASYVITGHERDPFNADATDLRGFVSRFPNSFRPVMANEDVAVYRIEHDPCRSSVTTK